MQSTMSAQLQLQVEVATAVVLFTIGEQALKVLFARGRGNDRDGAWTLPAGAIDAGADLDANAARALHERTGISDVYLEQLYTFGRARPAQDARSITVAYYALVPSDRLHLRPEPADELRWFGLDGLPRLPAGTEEIITMAHERLAAKLDYSTIAFQFMPEKFTLSELQSVYETILRERLDKRNFRKQVLALQRIEDTGEARRNGSHRPAKLFRLRYPDRVEIIK